MGSFEGRKAKCKKYRMKGTPIKRMREREAGEMEMTPR